MAAILVQRREKRRSLSAGSLHCLHLLQPRLAKGMHSCSGPAILPRNIVKTIVALRRRSTLSSRLLHSGGAEGESLRGEQTETPHAHAGRGVQRKLRLGESAVFHSRAGKKSRHSFEGKHLIGEGASGRRRCRRKAERDVGEQSLIGGRTRLLERVKEKERRGCSEKGRRKEGSCS
ncbi:uncharacterized protein BJX67DRAFT_143094 [Aspergillus lucknowensis]|uniref:Uncharacterized protein n=1 Tax=Aspergillus lucknowensis TaxID=176173 RepID=A0ABR4LP07_9EURO